MKRFISCIAFLWLLLSAVAPARAELPFEGLNMGPSGWKWVDHINEAIGRLLLGAPDSDFTSNKPKPNAQGTTKHAEKQQIQDEAEAQPKQKNFRQRSFGS